jgi:carbohydrate-selective porin OprB
MRRARFDSIRVRARALLVFVGALLIGSGLDRGTTTCRRSKLPGEYPQHRFRGPFPPLVEERQELRDKYLFGDWLGVRSQLAERGIHVTALFITDPFVNVLGGKQRGFADYNLFGSDLVVDTDKLVPWCGGQFHVGFAANFGTSLSKDYVGNTFPIQLADVADADARLTYLSYTQSLFDDRLSIRLGRLTINSVWGQEFLGSEYFKAFTSVGINLVPLGLFLNAPGAFGYPDTTWGARIKLEPVKQLYVMAGIYNGDPNLKSGERHGVDFSMHGPPFVIAEVGLRSHYGRDAPGLAGNLKLGAYEDGGRYGVYVVGDHELLRWGAPRQHRHLGLFGALVFTPNANAVPVFLDGGLVLYGPTRRRAKDFVGAALVYGDFEMTIEATYGLKLVPGLVLQPDVQYVIHPSHDARIPNALATGLNIIVTP